jgi:hypothetical protein
MTARGRVIGAVAGSIALAMGLAAGYEIAYAESLGGLGGAVGVGLFRFILVIAIGVAAVVALVSTVRNPDGATITARVAVACAALLCVGAAVAGVATPALGLSYTPDVVLQATGTSHVELTGTPRFVAAAAANVGCRSVPDGRSVEEATVLDAGELDGGTLRVHLALGPAGGAPASIELYIDAADTRRGSAQPMWSGGAAVTELRDEGRAGRVTFAQLSLRDPADKGDERSPRAAADPWPTSLSGAMTWSCGGWAR